jgi:hypothetical protein
MLYVFPCLTWLAAITSAVLLATLWSLGEMRRSIAAALLGWFLIAGYCQFFAGSPVVRAVGVLVQTLLAIVLSLRWKISN